MTISNTHAAKAKSYDIGRPEYPQDFFNFVYDEIGIKPSEVIADIGCGTGKIAKHFLEYGNTVVGVEPDSDMLSIAKSKLSVYPKFFPIQKSAENTGIEEGSIDHIFCGNSYHWFERSKVVPEFRRILRDNCKILISTLGGGSNPYDAELRQINENFKKDVSMVISDTSPAFSKGTSIEKTFSYVVYETKDEFLHGALSASFAPSVRDETYAPFVREVEELFERYKHNERLEVMMCLRCAAGSAENLLMP